jgi:hypothetical protein
MTRGRFAATLLLCGVLIWAEHAHAQSEAANAMCTAPNESSSPKERYNSSKPPYPAIYTEIQNGQVIFIKNLYRKPCSDNFVRAFCTTANYCDGEQSGSECFSDGKWKACDTPDQGAQRASGTGSAPTGEQPSVSTLEPPSETPKTSNRSGSQLADQLFFNPESVATNKDTIAPSAQNFEEQLRKAGAEPGLFQLAKDKVTSWFSPSPTGQVSELQPGGVFDGVETKSVQTTSGETLQSPDTFTRPDPWSANTTQDSSSEFAQRTGVWLGRDDSRILNPITAPGAIAEATRIFGADRGYSDAQIKNVADGLGGVAQQESSFNPNIPERGQYKGLGQLSDRETMNARNNIAALAESPNLTPAERARAGEIVTKIDSMLAQGLNPNKDAETGGWLLTARQANMPDIGRNVSPMDIAAQNASTAKEAAAIIQGAQLAPAMYARGFNLDKTLSGAEIRALTNNKIAVSSGMTVGDALTRLQTSSIYSRNFDRGIAVMNGEAVSATQYALNPWAGPATNNYYDTPTQLAMLGNNATIPSPLQPTYASNPFESSVSYASLTSPYAGAPIRVASLDSGYVPYIAGVNQEPIDFGYDASLYRQQENYEAYLAFNGYDAAAYAEQNALENARSNPLSQIPRTQWEMGPFGWQQVPAGGPSISASGIPVLPGGGVFEPEPLVAQTWGVHDVPLPQARPALAADFVAGYDASTASWTDWDSLVFNDAYGSIPESSDSYEAQRIANSYGMLGNEVALDDSSRQVLQNWVDARDGWNAFYGVDDTSLALRRQQNDLDDRRLVELARSGTVVADTPEIDYGAAQGREISSQEAREIIASQIDYGARVPSIDSVSDADVQRSLEAARDAEIAKQNAGKSPGQTLVQRVGERAYDTVNGWWSGIKSVFNGAPETQIDYGDVANVGFDGSDPTAAPAERPGLLARFNNWLGETFGTTSNVPGDVPSTMAGFDSSGAAPGTSLPDIDQYEYPQIDGVPQTSPRQESLVAFEERARNLTSTSEPAFDFRDPTILVADQTVFDFDAYGGTATQGELALLEQREQARIDELRQKEEDLRRTLPQATNPGLVERAWAWLTGAEAKRGITPLGDYMTQRLTETTAERLQLETAQLNRQLISAGTDDEVTSYIHTQLADKRDQLDRLESDVRAANDRLYSDGGAVPLSQRSTEQLVRDYESSVANLERAYGPNWQEKMREEVDGLKNLQIGEARSASPNNLAPLLDNERIRLALAEREADSLGSRSAIAAAQNVRPDISSSNSTAVRGEGLDVADYRDTPAVKPPVRDSTVVASTGDVSGFVPKQNALDLQEKVILENLGRQYAAVQETYETLREDAIERGALACESRPFGQTCAKYRSYSVAVQTEVAKYEQILKSYNDLQEYKNGGALSPDLRQSLALIEKGQGPASAALDTYAAPFKSAAGEWFTPLADNWREGDWLGVAKESWRVVPGVGNALWGGLVDSTKIAAERFAPDTLGFSPSPVEAATCGAIGQSACDVIAIGHATNVAGGVWGVGALGYGGTKLAGSFVSAVDDVARSGLGSRSVVDDIARVPDAPVVGPSTSLAEARPALPQVPQLSDDAFRTFDDAVERTREVLAGQNQARIAVGDVPDTIVPRGAAPEVPSARLPTAADDVPVSAPRVPANDNALPVASLPDNQPAPRTGAPNAATRFEDDLNTAVRDINTRSAPPVQSLRGTLNEIDSFNNQRSLARIFDDPENPPSKPVLDAEIDRINRVTEEIKWWSREGDLRPTAARDIDAAVKQMDEAVEQLRTLRDGPNAGAVNAYDDALRKIEDIKNSLRDTQASLPPPTIGERVQLAWQDYKKTASDAWNDVFGTTQTRNIQSADAPLPGVGPSLVDAPTTPPWNIGAPVDDVLPRVRVAAPTRQVDVSPSDVVQTAPRPSTPSLDNVSVTPWRLGSAAEDVATPPRTSVPSVGSARRDIDTGGIDPARIARAPEVQGGATAPEASRTVAQGAWEWTKQYGQAHPWQVGLLGFGGTWAAFSLGEKGVTSVTDTVSGWTSGVFGSGSGSPTGPGGFSPVTGGLVPPTGSPSLSPTRERVDLAGVMDTVSPAAATPPPNVPTPSPIIPPPSGPVLDRDYYCVKNLTPLVVTTVSAGMPFPTGQCYNSPWGGVGGSQPSGIGNMMGALLGRLFGTQNQQQTPQNPTLPSQQSATSPVQASVQQPAPSVTIIANPSSVIAGARSQIAWASARTDACTLFMATTTLGFKVPTSGSTTTAPITATSTFAITCIAANATTSAETTVGVK